MSSETLLLQFDVLADAPAGVQKLRELILELALRGKLVPQDPGDEPAFVLLERINAEKQRLSNEGKIGKPKPLPSIGQDEMPFEVPAGWMWVRIGEVTSKIGSGSTPLGGKQAYVARGIKFLRSQNVWNDGLRLEGVALIPPAVHERMSNTAVGAGDVLLNITGASIGRSAVVPDEFDEGNVSQHVAIVRPIDPATRHFLHLSLIAPYFQDAIMLTQVGISREGLSVGRLSEMPVPIPPVREQQRIVAKVGELMALCHELQARHRRRAEARTRLNRSALHHLTITDDAELPEHWQRLRENFDLLYDTPETVAKLRQAVLQLAVRGRLVPQDPTDEPASMLLEQISLDKQRLFREGKISKPQPLITIDEVPFDLPPGWVWTRFGDATINRDSERVPLASGIRAGRRGAYPYYGASGVIDYVDEYLFDKTLLLIGEDGANLLLRSTPIAFFAEGKYWVNNHAHVIDGITLDLLRYISIFINSTDLAPYVTGTAQPKLNQAKLNSIPIALPPLPEQRRIVAKVDALMALCDQLEARLASARVKASHLAASVVHHVTAA